MNLLIAEKWAEILTDSCMRNRQNLTDNWESRVKHLHADPLYGLTNIMRKSADVKCF